MILLLITSACLIIFGVMLTLANFLKFGAIVMTAGALIVIIVKMIDVLKDKKGKSK